MKKIISYVLKKVPRKYLQIFSPLFFFIIKFLYRGNKVECPLCHTRLKKFLPYGRIPRDNALCPVCLSLERHRLLYLFMNERTSFFQKKHVVLHIAPEVCFLKKFEEIHTNTYITADIESPLAKVKMDIHHIPYSDNFFDAILCNHVLEHVESDRKVLTELFRVLKKGGWAILQVPFFEPIPEITLEDPRIISPQERFKHYGQDDHLRKYGKDYAKRIKSVGFQVDENMFVKTFSHENIQRYGLPKDELIYFCEKI